jgi:hypothetical protein
MTEATLTGDALRSAVLSTIRKFTMSGTGIRTTECATNGTLISLAHDLDPYDGGGCYTTDRDAWFDMLKGLLDDGILVVFSEKLEGGRKRRDYCWLIPADMQNHWKVGPHLERVYDVFDWPDFRTPRFTLPQGDRQ